MDIQIKPIITEKANAYSEKQNCFTFAVSPDANKFQIKDIVEKLYNVRVERVKHLQLCGQAQAALHKRWPHPRPETGLQEGLRNCC